MAEQDILIKCKATIEDLESQLNGERGKTIAYNREKDRLDRDLEKARERERAATGKIVVLHVDEYQREVQKVTELQELVIQLRDHIARSSNNDARLSGMKDKIGAANSLNNELRNRVRVLEEINDRKDACIKDWNQTVEIFENELQKTIDDNSKLSQEREIVRNSLQQVGLVMMQVDQAGDGGSRR